jgi:predicted nucleotidyltransferase
MENNEILTKREREVINKKLNNLRLNQQDSNYLSRFVRPKLKAMKQINPDYLLNRLNYNPASRAIEQKIIKLVLKNIQKTHSVIIVGSAIQTNYSNYRDIDIIIITKKKYWDREIEKIRLCSKIEEEAKRDNLILDVQIISKKAFLNGYQSSPSLIYQLKDSKVIYGKIKIPNKINLSKMDLRMKLDWSDIEKYAEPKEIYNALRNTILVKLLMNKIIDNSRLRQEVKEKLGEELINHLKSNRLTRLEKKYALEYLKNLTEQTRKEVINAKWERIKI